MISQEQALKLANELFKEQNPYGVVYGYHVKRGINAKETHEYLDRPIVLKTETDLEVLIQKFLSKTSVTRQSPSRITGFDVLYHKLREGLKNKTYKIR